jgi:hypothetical protein
VKHILESIQISLHKGSSQSFPFHLDLLLVYQAERSSDFSWGQQTEYVGSVRVFQSLIKTRRENAASSLEVVNHLRPEPFHSFSLHSKLLFPRLLSRERRSVSLLAQLLFIIERIYIKRPELHSRFGFILHILKLLVTCNGGMRIGHRDYLPLPLKS